MDLPIALLVMTYVIVDLRTLRLSKFARSISELLTIRQCFYPNSKRIIHEIIL